MKAEQIEIIRKFETRVNMQQEYKILVNNIDVGTYKSKDSLDLAVSSLISTLSSTSEEDYIHYIDQDYESEVKINEV